jgi:predicted Zn-dependent peptidase/outer membrane lipoprotein-sorting protein
VEDKTTPLAYYSLPLDVKPALEKEKTGLADLFSDVFGKETTTRGKEQLSKELDLIAAQLSPHKNGGYIAFLKKYETQALDILSDVLLNPAFSQAEFDLSLEKYKTFLSSIGDDGSTINQRVTSALIYGKGYPGGEVMTQSTLDNIRLSDLENYYASYFAPNVARLVMIGDISLKEAKASAGKYFGKWKKKNVPVAKYQLPSAPQKTSLAYVNKPGAVQSSIDIAYPLAFSIGANDYDAARLMSLILGGSGSSRLFLNLRETHSYTYGLYTNLQADELVGSFSLTDGRTGAAGVKAALTDSAVYEIFGEMNRIINEPVTEQELKSAKSYLAGNFSRSLENSSTIATFALNIDKYKLPKDYYKNYLKRLEAVSIADIQAVAAKYIRPENAWLVVTGDNAYAESLLPFSGDQTVHYYDYDANPAEAPVVVKADISVEEIITAYVKALGGESAIDKISDYQMTGSMNMMGQEVSLTQVFKKPNQSSTTLAMNGMTLQKIAFDGTALRLSGMQGEQELTEGDAFESIKLEAAIVPELNYRPNGYTLEIGGIEKVNDSDAYVLNISKGTSKSTSYFDKETGLKLKSVASVDTPTGAQQTITEYGDYREVEGVKFPFLQKQNTAGMFMEISITSVEVNKGVDDSVFK